MNPNDWVSYFLQPVNHCVAVLRLFRANKQGETDRSHIHSLRK